VARIARVVTLIWLVGACQQPSPWTPPDPPDPTEECDGDGPECTGRCCEPGYDCQRGECVDAAQDLDGDGYIAHRDCDDYDPDTYPGAQELCDRRDNDCDGVVDDGVRDADGECLVDCPDADSDGVAECDGDCNDLVSDIYPGAPEPCDGVDNDCDGVVDDGDADGDGEPACSDCDDAEPLAAPGFDEVCDGVDNDCDGTADDGVLCGGEGECVGVCRWTWDATAAEVDHDCGVAESARWCSDDGCENGEVLAAAPDGGIDSLPEGNYLALVRALVREHDADCGPVFRIRVTDLDGDGTGSCMDCFFGGDRSVRPITRDFPELREWYDFDIPFSIGGSRTGHRILVVAPRSRCAAVDVCLRLIRIVEE